MASSQPARRCWCWRSSRSLSWARSACWRAHRHHPGVGSGPVTVPKQPKHSAALTRRSVPAGELLQDLLGLGPMRCGPRQLPGPVPGGLVQQGAQPVAFRPELSGGQPPQVQGAGGVDRQPLVAGAGKRLGELGVAVADLSVGQVQLGRPLGFGADHRIQPGVLAGPRQLHVQPVGILAAGQADQRPPPGEALGAVAGGGVGQVDPAVALPPATAVQIPSRQRHLFGVLGVDPDGQRPGLGVQGGDGAAGGVSDPQLADGVAAAHHPIPHR